MDSKIKEILRFYLLATELKNKIRTGWVVWNVDKERLESVSEHIYGTCILAVAITSEFDVKVNLQKVILMLVLHELEEVKIGDLTPFDNVTEQDKKEMAGEAIKWILGDLSKKDEYIDLLKEFEEQQTVESKFAKRCDKLEADIQAKLYCDEKVCNINNPKNAHLLKDDRVQSLIQNGAKTVADLYIEYDRPKFIETEFKLILDYIKAYNLKDLLGESE